MNPGSILRSILVAAFWLTPLVAAYASPTYVGEVISIADGDTLTILTDGRRIKVRLAHIDTPERSHRACVPWLNRRRRHTASHPSLQKRRLKSMGGTD